MFVALTFDGKLGATSNPALRDLARQTFADFLSVLVKSLVLLAPRMSRLSTALFIFISGLLGAKRILRSLLSMLRHSAWRNASRQIISRFLLSMIGNSGLLLAGALLIVPDHDPATFWSTLFGSMIGLLLSGSRSAWMLVTQDA